MTPIEYSYKLGVILCLIALVVAFYFSVKLTASVCKRTGAQWNTQTNMFTGEVVAGRWVELWGWARILCSGPLLVLLILTGVESTRWLLAHPGLVAIVVASLLLALVLAFGARLLRARPKPPVAVAPPPAPIAPPPPGTFLPPEVDQWDYRAP